MTPGISIVICTYNGAARLPETLRHIALQEVPGDIPWELIIVDNASSDNTLEVAREEWTKYQCTVPFNIHHQPELGLSHARHFGYQKSSFDFIILCDDDNWLNRDYVENAYRIMMQHKNIGILGGWGELRFGKRAPAWITGYSLFAGGRQAEHNGKVESGLLYGAGAVLRKKAYEDILKGGFVSLLTDRMGTLLTSGGDYELCYALALAGYDIWYDDRLRFQHFIPAERLTWEYYLKYIEESSKCFEVLEPYKILLKTGNSSMFSFNSSLVKSYLYHLKQMLPVFFQKLSSGNTNEENQIIRLKYIYLATRLESYKYYRRMRKNFAAAVRFRQDLEQLSDEQ